MISQQGITHGLGHNFTNFIFPVKLHFPLGGMNIHVHRRGVNLEKETADRITPLHQGGVVTFNQRVINAAIFHGAAVNEYKLTVTGGS